MEQGCLDHPEGYEESHPPRDQKLCWDSMRGEEEAPVRGWQGGEWGPESSRCPGECDRLGEAVAKAGQV